MSSSHFASTNHQSNKVDNIWQEVKQLSTDEKAELVEKLLGKESGLIVVSGSTHLVNYILAQMSLLSSEGLAHVLGAAASQLISEDISY